MYFTNINITIYANELHLLFEERQAVRLYSSCSDIEGYINYYIKITIHNDITCDARYSEKYKSQQISSVVTEVKISTILMSGEL